MRDDLTGKRFGRLVVIQFTRSTPDGHSFWLCQCECGCQKEVRRNCLTHNREPTRSCGCLQRETARAAAKHGKSSTSVYKIWTSMKQRCLNPVNPNYKDYGGRGIRVCERWLEFENFLKDMGDPPQRGRGKGLLSIERINNDGDYEPSNCRWAPMKEQLLNRRKTVWMTHQGKRKPLLVWCREYRIDYATAKYRLKMGKDSKEVLEKPESRIGPVTHGGVTKSLVEWSKQTGIRVATLSYRLRNGWPVKEALEISVK